MSPTDKQRIHVKKGTNYDFWTKYLFWMVIYVVHYVPLSSKYCDGELPSMVCRQALWFKISNLWITIHVVTRDCKWDSMNHSTYMSRVSNPKNYSNCKDPQHICMFLTPYDWGHKKSNGLATVSSNHFNFHQPLVYTTIPFLSMNFNFMELKTMNDSSLWLHNLKGLSEVTWTIWILDTLRDK